MDITHWLIKSQSGYAHRRSRTFSKLTIVGHGPVYEQQQQQKSSSL